MLSKWCVLVVAVLSAWMVQAAIIEIDPENSEEELLYDNAVPQGEEGDQLCLGDACVGRGVISVSHERHLDPSDHTLTTEAPPRHKTTSPVETNVGCPACPTLPPRQERQHDCPPARRHPFPWAPPARPVACPSPCPACPSCAKPLPPGYERHEGHGAYRVHLIPRNWFDAQATCEREGGHLAVINSKEEADILARILSRYTIPYNYVLMGFHDLNYEGSFYTVLDTPLRSSGYLKWANEEPNDKNNEDCGGMYVSDMTFNDQHCERYVGAFICEIP